MYTIQKIKEEMQEVGSHWWDDKTIEFFNTIVESEVYEGPGGIFFITSEKPPNSPRFTHKRKFCVREYHPERRRIETYRFYQLSETEAEELAESLSMGGIG